LPAVTPLPAAVDPKPFKQGSDPPEDRAHGLAAHWQELVVAVEACRACALGATRQRSVPGCGPVDARCLLVGEAPGAEEDRQGLPFVGRAGALLNQMLAAVGLDRERDVYVTNALKCRPPGNRNPEPDESMRCRPFLQRQVELLSPGLAVLMGRYAAQSILQSDASIASLRGLVHRATVGTATVRCIVTYHPAYLLRNPQDKAKAWRDWALVRRTLETTAETSA
jgi:DNA polymerase